MTVVLHNSRERVRFLRFAVVGAIGAVVDFGVSNLLIHLCFFTRELAGSISFICAILSNFFWNRFWTYPDSRSKKLASHLLQFALVSLFGLAIRIPILAYLGPVIEAFTFHYDIRLPGLLGPKDIADNLTLAIAVIVAMFWNFFANRYWTYSDID